MYIASGARPTPMGKTPHGKNQVAEYLVGVGKRATTFRSRVRMARRFLIWLSVNFKATFPTRVEPLTDYLQSQSECEPCNRGALRNTHRAFGFLDEAAGVTSDETISKNPQYAVLFFTRCCLKADAGKAIKTLAPRMPVALLMVIEKFSMDLSNLPYHASLRTVHGATELDHAPILGSPGSSSRQHCFGAPQGSLPSLSRSVTLGYGQEHSITPSFVWIFRALWRNPHGWKQACAYSAS